MDETDISEWELQMHANEPGHELSGFDAVQVYDDERRLRQLDVYDWSQDSEL